MGQPSSYGGMHRLWKRPVENCPRGVSRRRRDQESVNTVCRNHTAIHIQERLRAAAPSRCLRPASAASGPWTDTVVHSGIPATQPFSIHKKAPTEPVTEPPGRMYCRHKSIYDNELLQFAQRLFACRRSRGCVPCALETFRVREPPGLQHGFSSQPLRRSNDGRRGRPRRRLARGPLGPKPAGSGEARSPSRSGRSGGAFTAEGNG